jgi:hypothetical protein
MKPISSALALVVLTSAVTASAQNSPVQTTQMSESPPGKTMTTKEKIRQLQPATNVVELMRLLKNIHEQALLIDPYFIEDENIFRLFGPGRIEAAVRRNKSQTGDHIFYSKYWIPNSNNPLQMPVRFSGVGQAPGFGGLVIGNGAYKSVLPPISSELIETILMPGAQGSDPLDPREPLINEAREESVRRGFSDHPKGFWTYLQRNKTADYMADLYVALDRNAQVTQIDLTQRGE